MKKHAFSWAEEVSAIIFLLRLVLVTTNFTFVSSAYCFFSPQCSFFPVLSVHLPVMEIQNKSYLDIQTGIPILSSNSSLRLHCWSFHSKTEIKFRYRFERISSNTGNLWIVKFKAMHGEYPGQDYRSLTLIYILIVYNVITIYTDDILFMYRYLYVCMLRCVCWNLYTCRQSSLLKMHHLLRISYNGIAFIAFIDHYEYFSIISYFLLRLLSSRELTLKFCFKKFTLWCKYANDSHWLLESNTWILMLKSLSMLLLSQHLSYTTKKACILKLLWRYEGFTL